MKKRSQIAMEFMLIIAISFTIITAGMYMFRNYALESSDRILERKVAEIANDIITEARKMYYYGPPSRTLLEIEMPAQIDDMYVLSIPAQDEYVLVFDVLTSDGAKEYSFDSDVPLTALTAEENCPDREIGTCEFFPGITYSKGLKNLNVRSASGCTLDSVELDNCIVIEEISSELE